ncbi:MAG: DNA recombination protein RmuC [Gammaproteobacteria bacterium]|nr:DNA recombination protein RmuC [Gammaproteobacteria bacterium]
MPLVFTATDSAKEAHGNCMNSLSNVAIAASSPVSLLLVLTGVALIVMLALLLQRTRALRESQSRQEQQLLSLETLRGVVESLAQHTREHQHQGSAEASRLRESLIERTEAVRLAVTQDLARQKLELNDQLAASRTQVGAAMNEYQVAFEARQTQAVRTLHETLQQGFQALHQQLGETLQRNAGELGQRFELLTRSTDERLREISGQVDRRLTEGFEKSTQIFHDVIKRLALIDEAQKKITALSGDVISLQQILADKRSRGAFGEIQLASLVRNVMPESAFSLQHTLENGRIADCMLFLPPPTGSIAIDAKFPLEAYRRMTDFAAPETERKQAERQFKQDIRKHIKDIASRYIIPGKTADGAMMFIPAEAVFAEIQAHHAELVDEAHAARVWLVSPTTLWAVLNTACAVLKDAATREQVDIIREHLGHLGKDFNRFRERMDQLARHIEQAHEDVQKVNISARRITDRFQRIERVEVQGPAERLLEEPLPSDEAAV